MIGPATSRHRSLNRDHDRRLTRRVSVAWLGRFMLQDRLERPCQTRDISPGGVALTSAVAGEVGEHVVAYLDSVGRVEGTIVRTLDGGFAMTIKATFRKKDKLADKFTWVANRRELKLPEDRRHERVIPKRTKLTVISLPDGRKYPATVIDISLSGAAVAAEVKPPIGSPVTIGKLRAAVVRYRDAGFAVEFATVQTVTTLEPNLAPGAVPLPDEPPSD